MKIRIGHATHVGLQRKRNEDSYLVYVPWGGGSGPSGLDALLLVADGMGGERGGDRASQLVCEQFRRWFTKADYRQWEDLSPTEPLFDALRRAFVAVGQEILGIGLEEPDFVGMGTTAVLAAVEGETVTIAHVGDSRCYRIRDRSIERMTKDHSWVEQQVEAGILSPEQAFHHPHRNILLKSLGDEELSEPDLRQMKLLEGDLLVLCSDGLCGGVEDREILAEVLETRGPQKLAERLVQIANERDGSDNVTVVVASCENDSTITEEITLPDLAKSELGIP